MSKDKNNTAAAKTSKGKKSERRKQRERLKKKLAADCSQLLGERITEMQYPGGRSRSSFRLVLETGSPVIVSIRKTRQRADLERTVLKELAPRGAQVPHLIAGDKRRLLIQEEIPGERLSQALHGQDEATVERLLDAALTSLSESQRLGSEAGFDAQLTPLGGSFDWLVGLLDRPAVIGNFLGVPPARPQLGPLEELLAVRQPRFVKWDSRPGNAMVKADGQVYWFDWEHCGTRNRLDDMAWLLADEYVPDYPAVEERLIDKHIASFADDLSVDEAKQYLSAYGVFHLSVRLGLICKYKRRGDWWDQDYCLERDKVGVTRESMLRTCSRGERWARRNPNTESLASWYAAMADLFHEQPSAVGQTSPATLAAASRG